MIDEIFDFEELIMDSRTVRRYEENTKIPESDLRWLVNLCRFTASAGNRQPTRFIIINEKSIRDKIFNNLGWLGYIAEDLGPE